MGQNGTSPFSSITALEKRMEAIPGNVAVASLMGVDVGTWRVKKQSAMEGKELKKLLARISSRT